jgi:hypothetical protein
MKLLPLLSLPLALLLSPGAQAADYRAAGHTGLGLGVGTASGGISIKHFLTDGTAVQGVIGAWGGWGYSGLGLSADYLFEMPYIAETDDLDVAWNIGPGLGLGIYSGPNLITVAASGVLGLELGFNPVPIDIVFEYRPTLYLGNSGYYGRHYGSGLGFDPNAFSGHVRWFF